MIHVTEDQEFRLLDLWTAPVDLPPKRHSTIGGYVSAELMDLWEMGLITRICSGGIRLTQSGREAIGVYPTARSS